MNDPQIRIRKDKEYSSSGNIKYICEVWHKGLNNYRYLSAPDEDVLQNKVESHISILEQKWEREQEKKNSINSKQASQREAEQRTKSAKADLAAIEEILTFTLEIDDSINWHSLINNSPYPARDPKDLLGNKINNIPSPKKAPYKVISDKPDSTDIKYNPNLGFIDKIFPFFGKDKIKKKEELYKSDLNLWESEAAQTKVHNDGIDKKFQKQNQEYDNKVGALKAQTYEDSKQWESDRNSYLKKQEEFNSKVEKLKSDYKEGKPGAIIEACEIVLNNSMYPDFIQKNFEIEYNPDTKILIVEYSLPAPDQLPTLQEVKYLKDELKEYHISESQNAKNFDSLVYKLTLRTLHELFEADQVRAIDAISFNGLVNSVDKSTGKRVNSCIVSIQVKKEEFTHIELQHVDPKACFKALKGVGSSKLVGLTPVQPILKIDKSDKRFVAHYDVADSIDDSTNIASMGWEDFEHLIREVFAKEFSQSGGEVKVTQASKDGGVDAIAFDPDPIRGGKIVIQAKRYTNTVGVSAVRDLYGTVMNEGATKGILVTTADYGPDAYEFSKGKPITLMNGANLLYLLEKHGHKAKIDIKEAKLMMKNK